MPSSDLPSADTDPVMAARQDNIVTVIGRGHSGTRAIAETLSRSGVFMGSPLNHSWDLGPADDFYAACRIMNRHVRYLGGLRWDFSQLHTMPIDPAFTRLVESYLATVLDSDARWRGWKLPETTLVLPWIVRLFPDINYIFWVRDPRDSILGRHVTDDLGRWGVESEPADDLRTMRAISWKYQADLVRSTPTPKRWHVVRFEDFVCDRAATLRGLENYLGFPLRAAPVRRSAVGRWRQDDGIHHFDFLTPDLIDLGYVTPGDQVPFRAPRSLRERLQVRWHTAVGRVRRPGG